MKHSSEKIISKCECVVQNLVFQQMEKTMILNLFRYRKKSTTKCREIHFIKAETGQQSPRQRPDGDRRSDDGKPRDSVSDTVGNMAAGGLAKRFTVGQQVFNDFLR